MQINWFTVIAQIVNFLILVWLLKRFLYKPVLSAIDAREKRIVAQLQDADARKAEAKQERDGFQQKNEAFDRERAALVQKAIEEARAERQRLLEDARKESGELRSNLEKSLSEEQENNNREIIRLTREEVFAIAGKTLADLASLSLEEQSVHVFIDRLRRSTDQEKEQFRAAFQTPPASLVIRSAFDLSAATCREIEEAVRELIPAGAVFQYETQPALVCGIEILSGGYKLGWNIPAYLASMEKALTKKTATTEKEAESPINQENPIKQESHVNQ
jgi:F-type H+-transporting ATPase subunit b